MKIQAIIVVTIIAALGAFALADDVLPPAWRGGPNTITAEWDIFTPLGLGPGSQAVMGDMVTDNPDIWNNTDIVGQASWNSSAWVYGTYMGRNGVIEVNPGGGIAPLSFSLRNFDNNNPVKNIRIQITQLGAGPLDFYIGALAAPGEEPWPNPNYPSFNKVDAIVSEFYQHPDGWVTRAYDLQIMPNPDFEAIGLDWGFAMTTPAWIDQVVIDTQCLPEPATMSLLLVGLPALLRRKR